MCSKKHWFFTEEEALQGAERLSRHLGTLRPYWCPECRLWRLTSGVVHDPKKKGEVFGPLDTEAS